VTLACKRLFTPLFGVLWHIPPPKNVTHRRNPKRTVFGRNHIIWAIKREYRPRGSSWALKQEKRIGQKKSHKRVIIFTYLGRSPHTSDLHQKLCSGWPTGRNHVWQVSKWNFQGLPFYMARIFHCPIDIRMGLTTVQRYCTACDCFFTEACNTSPIYAVVLCLSVTSRYFTVLLKWLNVG